MSSANRNYCLIDFHPNIDGLVIATEPLRAFWCSKWFSQYDVANFEVFFRQMFARQSDNGFHSRKRSAITNKEKVTDAMPLVVKNARFTRLRSFGFTMEC